MSKIKKRNVIVGQSGGPTAAINSSLAGVISYLLKSDLVDTVYGMRNGIEGLLKERYIDLSDYIKNDLQKVIDDIERIRKENVAQ